MNVINKILKNPIYVDFIKIGASIFLYIFVILIFKAGYDYQSIVEIRTKQEKEDYKEYSYEVKINNTEYKTIKFNEEKNLFSILNSFDKIKIQYTSFYEGNEIKSINGNANFRIILNDKVIESKFFKENEMKVPEKSFIQIYF